jgi:hypothetical protein
MKSNMILKKYRTTDVKGTFNLRELSTFFGSKLIEIEDKIQINGLTIQYYQRASDGFQFYDLATLGGTESIFTLNLNELKAENHVVELFQQTEINLLNNTRWRFTIDLTKILTEYLFARLKERRTFKAIQSEDLFQKVINSAIYNYIDYNIIDRYRFTSIDFYVAYSNILTTQKVASSVKLQYDPQWNLNVKKNNNLVNNLNIVSNNDNLGNLVFNYNQIKPSTDYRFDYYFELHFEKL